MISTSLLFALRPLLVLSPHSRGGHCPLSCCWKSQSRLSSQPSLGPHPPPAGHPHLPTVRTGDWREQWRRILQIIVSFASKLELLNFHKTFKLIKSKCICSKNSVIFLYKFSWKSPEYYFRWNFGNIQFTFWLLIMLLILSPDQKNPAAEVGYI